MEMTNGDDSFFPEAIGWALDFQKQVIKFLKISHYLTIL